MKHQNIATLMGLSYDNDLRVMSLVIEPFDYTLNHYMHGMVNQFDHLNLILLQTHYLLGPILLDSTGNLDCEANRRCHTVSSRVWTCSL